MTVSSSTTRQGEIASLRVRFSKNLLVGTHVPFRCGMHRHALYKIRCSPTYLADRTSKLELCLLPEPIPTSTLLLNDTLVGTCGGKYAQWPSTRCPTVKQKSLTMSCIVEQGEMRWLYGVRLSGCKLRLRPETAVRLPRTASGRKAAGGVRLACCGVQAAGTARPLAGVSVQRRKRSRSVAWGGNRDVHVFCPQLVRS